MIKRRALHPLPSWVLVPVLVLLVGRSALAEDARGDRVDELFRAFIQPDAPGCSLGVVRDGEFVYRNAYGMASLEQNVPLSTRSVFRTGSVGKQFTAFAVLLAEQQGKLSVDDDIRKYLPELPETPEVITLSNLIHHTSGIRDYLMLMSLAGEREEDFYTEQDVVDRLVRQEHLNFSPGTEYLYSNSGYFLLSQILLRATGESLREFARKNIFEPLSMEHTHFHDDFRMVVKDRAEGYRPKAGGGFEIDRTTLNMVGDGGVFTTVDDLIHWDENFDSGRVGGMGLEARRLETGRLKDGTPETYAYGLRIGSYRGRRTVSHGGSFVGFRAATLRFPDDRFSVYVLCNRSDAEPEKLALRVSDVLLFPPQTRETANPPPAIALEAEQVKRLTGTYFDRETGGLVEVRLADDGALHLDGRKAPLVPRSRTEFRIQSDDEGDTTVRFETAADGQRMSVEGEGNRAFSYLRVETVHPGLETLARYIGLYRCRELDVTYRIELGDGDHRDALQLVSPAGTFPLAPAFADGFRWKEGSLLFARGSDGRVSGFELAAGRARNFVFYAVTIDR